MFQHRYFIINKPRGMVSQFVSSHEVPLLGDMDFKFPEGTHAIGRLDRDSEGLLILTTDKTVTRKLFLASEPHLRTYLVMVQNEMSDKTFQHLQRGVEIKIAAGEKYIAVPEEINIINEPSPLYPFSDDARNIYPHTWLLLTLKEGKFRQVRKMVLAVKHRCLRLVRISISGIKLESLAPGEVKELQPEEFFDLLQNRKAR